MNYKRTVKKFGFINVLKPSGVTSSFVVNKIKRLTGQPCGHMGTLDPMASGVLPVGVGNATRLFEYFLQKKKTYVAEFLFGATSDTLDTTGEVVLGGKIPKKEQIESVLSSLIGEVEQLPPKYSAKSVGGKRGYDLARAGIEFELQPKRVQIDKIALLGEGKGKNTFRFEIDCGAGTYIRSIARDMGAALGTQAIMSGLERTKSGLFLIADGIPMDELTEENVENAIIPTEDVLPFEKVFLASQNKIFNGVAQRTDLRGGLYRAYQDDVFYGIAQVENGVMKLTVKLC